MSTTTSALPLTIAADPVTLAVGGRAYQGWTRLRVSRARCVATLTQST